MDHLENMLNLWNQSGPDAKKCLGGWHVVKSDECELHMPTIILDWLVLEGELIFSTVVGIKWLRNLSLAKNLFNSRLMEKMHTLEVLDLFRNHFY